jgi:AcrR family transcriptional regulator
MSAPRTARDRIRDEVTREILVVARAHLGQEGAAALSLRSIARELEMAPSALYRYFDSRDALLSALILGAYTSLADDAEAAAAGAPKDPLLQWATVPRAVRHWALERPQEWGLIFGSPVPGYEAPLDTVVPYTRFATALAQPVIDAFALGTLLVSTSAEPDEKALTASLLPVTEGLLPGLPIAAVARTLESFTTMIGIISLEIFGHWRNTVLAPEDFFEATIAHLAVTVGLCP